MLKYIGLAAMLLAPVAAHATGPQSPEAHVARGVRALKLPGVSGIKASNVILKPFGQPSGPAFVKYKYVVTNVQQRKLTPGQVQNFAIALKKITGTAWRTSIEGNQVIIKSANVENYAVQ